jgi:hypothetical protein
MRRHGVTFRRAEVHAAAKKESATCCATGAGRRFTILTIATRLSGLFFAQSASPA